MRGCFVVEEPGRRILDEEMAGEGGAPSRVDKSTFAEHAAAMSLSDRTMAVAERGLVFFDRWLVDALAALDHTSGEGHLELAQEHRYNQNRLLAPPWPQIYAVDELRQHCFEVAVAEYDRLTHNSVTLDHKIHVLPKMPAAERADLIFGRQGPRKAKI